MITLKLVLDLVYVAVLLGVTYKDIRERRIPNVVIGPAILLATVALFFVFPGWRAGAIGAFFGAGVMLIPVVTMGKKGGMGDVKLAFFMGLILGWPLILPALIIAHLSAATLLIGVIFKWLDRHTLIPFGPFLALGTLILLAIPYLR